MRCWVDSKFRSSKCQFFIILRGGSFCSVLDGLLTSGFSGPVWSWIFTHEIIAIISKDNIVKLYIKSNEFPNWKWKFKIGEPVPQTTVSGEYYNVENWKFTTVEQLAADDWFNSPADDHRANRQMYELTFTLIDMVTWSV